MRNKIEVTMSGRKINDHSSWVGKAASGEVFPDGAKVKTYTSAEGSGAVGMYEDTTEKIKEQQVMSNKKIKSHPQKSLHRY